MWNSLARRDRRALGFAALVLLPFLGWRTGALDTLGADSALQARLEGQRDLLATELAVLSEGPIQDRRADAIVAALASYAPRVFPTADAMEQRIEGLAIDAGLRVETIVPVDPDSLQDAHRGAIEVVEVQLDGRADLEGLLTFLATLREDARLLVARRLDARLAQDEPDPAAPDDLAVSVLVRGFVSASQPPGAEETP